MTTIENTQTEANKHTVRKLFTAFAAADDEGVGELLSPDFLAHGMPPGCSDDAAGMKTNLALMHAGLHDCHNDIEDMVAEGDRVAVRYTTRAVHHGELFGIPPSGRRVTLTGIEMYRLADGKIAEFWGEYNISDLFEAPTSD